MSQDIGTARPGLVGRSAELELARRALVAAYDGHGLLVLLRGEAGIGKTRLAEELADGAAGEGVAVAWVTGSPSAGPMWVWHRVLTMLGLGPVTERTTTAEADDPELARLRVFSRVADQLRSRGQPVLAVLDDLHLAGAASLQLLDFLADELRHDPIAVLAAVRSPGPSPNPLFRLEQRAVVVPVRGLANDAVAFLVREATGSPLPDAATTRVVARSRGNPLFALELARLLPADATALPGDATALPGTVRDVFRQRLQGLATAVVDLLGQAAVSGDTFSSRVLSRVAGEEPGTVADRCAEAVRHDLLRPVPHTVDSFAFAHPLLRDVLYEGLLPSRARQLHRLTAEALSARPHAEAELAHHWLRAGEYADPAAMLRYVTRAVDDAFAVSAWDEAADLLAHALDHVATFGGPPEARGRLLLLLGQARQRGGDWTTAAAAFQDAAAEARGLGDAGLLAQAALGLGSGRGGFEVRLYDRAQIELLAEARTLLGDDDGDLTAWILARLSVALSLRADPEVRAALADEAVALAETIDSPLPLAHALAARCDVRAGPEHRDQRLADATRVVDIAVAEGDREVELLGRRLRLVALLEAGRLPEADTEITAFARTADELGQPLQAWYVPLWKAMRLLMDGRLDEAAECAGHAAELGARAGSRNAEILVAAQRITWLVESGRAEEACALCEREFPPPAFPATPGWLAGLLARAGRGAEATALLDRLAAERFASLPRDSEWVAALCLAADGAAMVGHTPAAEVLRELLAPYADHWAVDGIGAACLGRVSGYLERLADVAPAAPPEPGPGSGRFRHDGELWTLEYDGATVRLRNAKGLHDLARLVAEPAREFHVLDLVSATGRGGAPPDAHLHQPGHAGEVLDEAARSAYRRRLAELDTEVDEFADTDPGRAERARAERDALVDALAAAYGLGGRPRHLDDPVDRARSTVTQRIRAALRRIEQQHPALGAHLRNSIRTGTYCSYRPERPVTWLR